MTPITVAMLACGCAQSPAPLPEPPPVIVIDCRVPDDLFASAQEPSLPEGQYTQRDVARYVVQLAGWGRAASRRLDQVRAFSEQCGRGHDG